LGYSPISGAVTRWRDVRFSNAATIWLLAAAGSATDSPTAGAHAPIGVIQISIFDLRICSASQQLERAEGKKLVRRMRNSSSSSSACPRIFRRLRSVRNLRSVD
ncbi:hypothetical protein T4E_824, partial [Trichinella pseudospiralis]